VVVPEVCGVGMGAVAPCPRGLVFRSLASRRRIPVGGRTRAVDGATGEGALSAGCASAAPMVARAGCSSPGEAVRDAGRSEAEASARRRGGRTSRGRGWGVGGPTGAPPVPGRSAGRGCAGGRRGRCLLAGPCGPRRSLARGRGGGSVVLKVCGARSHRFEAGGRPWAVVGATGAGVMSAPGRSAGRGRAGGRRGRCWLARVGAGFGVFGGAVCGASDPKVR